MFNTVRNIVIGTLAAVVVVAVGASIYTSFAAPGAVSAAPAMTPVPNSFGGQAAGNAYANGNGTGTPVLDIPASDLSDAEAAALLFMVQEEQLARDVYNQLFTVWGQPTFQSIALSEQTHMDQIRMLIDRYGLAAPVLSPGQFTDPELQALYSRLTADGSVSLAAALKVGAAIEELDILDLQLYLAQADNADLQQVFNSLMQGSDNHLAAFTGALQQQTGEVYQPQYMTAEQYQLALSSINGNRDGGAAGGRPGAAGAAGQRGNGYGSGNGNGRWGAGSVLPTPQP